MKKFSFYILLTLLTHGVTAQRSRDTLPNLPDHYRQKVAEFKKENIEKGRIIFLGNSITEGGNWRSLLKDSSVVNRGISGDNTYGVLQRLDDIIRRQPSRLFILIGINDLFRNIPDEEVMQNTFSIVRRIKRGSPATKIFLQSILPVNSSFKNFPNGYNKDSHVTTLNHEFKKYEDRMGYTFVDLYSEFLDKDARLEATYSTDGLHLSRAGYVHWVEVLRRLKCL